MQHHRLLSLLFALLLAVAAFHAACGHGVAADKPVVIQDAKARMMAVAVSPNGNYIAAGGYEAAPDKSDHRIVRVWDLKTLREAMSFSIKAGEVRALAFSKDSIYLAAGDDKGVVSVWHLPGKRLEFASPSQDVAIDAILFEEKDSYVIAAAGSRFQLWDIHKRQLVTSREAHGGSGAADLDLNDVGSILASCGGTEAALLNPVTFQVLRRFPGHQRGVNSVALSVGTELFMATGDDEGIIKYWHAGKGRQLASWQGHPKGVSHLGFYDDNQKLVSAGYDGTIRFWDLKTGKQLSLIKASTLAVDALALSRGRTLLVNNDNSGIQLRHLDPAQSDQTRPFQPGVSTANALPGEAKSSPTKSPGDLNDLDAWEIVRGDWKDEQGRLVGSGDSQIQLKQKLPNDVTLRFRMKMTGRTNPRVRFGSFHFGRERRPVLFLHGPQATGTPFPFEADQEVLVEVKVAGETAILHVDGKEVARSNPKTLEERTIRFEGGGKASEGSTEFWDIELNPRDDGKSRKKT